jgi:uncharacterized cupredoxin-like copper-binding protein
MKLLRILFIVVSATLVAACGSSAGATGGGGVSVGVVLDEYNLTVDQQTVQAGAITFKISNIGREKHELVILRTDLPLDGIPKSTEDPAKIAEEGSEVTHVNELDGVDPGQEKDLTVTLQPGRYMLVCNYPGHAHAGMATAFIVET